MSDNINSAAEAVNNEIARKTAELRTEINSDIETRNNAIVQKLNDEIATLRADLDDIVSKGARPTTTQDDASTANAEFKNFIRTGIETRATAVTTGVPAAGGFAVPEAIDRNIVNLALNVSPLLGEVTVLQTATPDVKVLVSVGGTTTAWGDETGSADPLGMRSTTGTPELAEVSIPFGHLYAKALISHYALNDVFFNAEKEVEQKISDDVAAKVGASILTGTGSNQPKGILTYTTAATADGVRAFGQIQHIASGTSAQLGADAATKLAKLNDLIFAMKPQHRAKAKFYMSKATLGEYAGLVDGNGNQAWRPSLAAGVPSTLMGYPVVECEDVPGKGAGSLSVVFADLTEYRVYDLVGANMLRDPYSYDAFIALKMNKRFGGALVNSEAVKVLKCAAA